MSNIEVLEYCGEGYMPLVRYENWRVAVINYAYRFDISNFVQMEKHSLTDEVFVLVNGSAILVVGIEKSRIVMEKQKLYNLKKGCWHHILLEKDACIVVVENDDTSTENTEYMNI